MQARYYIYRNLHTGGFSVRYRGKVVDRITDAIVKDAEFRVNQRGYERTVAQSQRNVHAFIVCDKYLSQTSGQAIDTSRSISYNPFKSNQFVCDGIPIDRAAKVALKDGRCYMQ